VDERLIARGYDGATAFQLQGRQQPQEKHQAQHTERDKDWESHGNLISAAANRPQ
jgi:hypothetical protein